MNKIAFFVLVAVAFGAGIVSDNWATRYERAAKAVGVKPAFQADALTGSSSITDIGTGYIQMGEVKACPEIAPRKFYQQKDKTWLELNPQSHMGWKDITLSLAPIGGGVTFETTSEITPRELQRIASKLLEESTKRELR